MTGRQDPDRDGLAFSCPHCGGPLHLVPGGVECADGHQFTLSEVGREQARTSAKAAWAAVRALQERATMSRWALSDPDVYGVGDPETLEESAAADEEMAEVLRRHAEALDRTLVRRYRLDPDDSVDTPS